MLKRTFPTPALALILLAAVVAAGMAQTRTDVRTAGTRPEPSLWEAFQRAFPIGFSSGILDDERAALVAHHAATLTCENLLKPRMLRPEPEGWSFDGADRWLDMTEALGLRPVGHVLVWSYQMPEWLLDKIQAGALGKESLLAWQDEYIAGVLQRYGSRIKTWDVVNEALADGTDDEDFLRKDPYLDLGGVDMIVRAFKAARKAAPDARLVYNDYLLYEPAKRKRLFRLLEILEREGCAPDIIGMQGHFMLAAPDLAGLERAIVEIHEAGYPVAITELDVSVYQRSGGADVSLKEFAETQPVIENLTHELHQQLADRCREIFALFLKHRDKIDRVSLWNTDDGNTWLNNWPVKNRPDHPHLFDRQLQPKPAFDAVISLTEPAVHHPATSPLGGSPNRNHPPGSPSQTHR